MGETQSLQVLDYVVIVSYFSIVVFVGMYFSKFIKQAKDYFAAGAAVPWWLAGISLWMASFSAMTFVIYSQLAYKYGLVATTLCWVVIPAMIVAAAFLALRWRRARVLTPLGFMEQRYSKAVHQLFVWTGIPLRFIDNALRVYSTAIFLVMAIGQSWNLTQHCRKPPSKTVFLKPLVIVLEWGYIENLPMSILREPPAISIMLFSVNQQSLLLSLMVKVFIIQW